MVDERAECMIDVSRVGKPANKVVGKGSPIQKLADLILGEAVKNGADSIRIGASAEDTVTIECRVEGEWRAVDSPPRRLLEALLAHLLLAQEYGPNGLPVLSRGSASVAKLTVNDMSLTITLPTDAAEG